MLVHQCWKSLLYLTLLLLGTLLCSRCSSEVNYKQQLRDLLEDFDAVAYHEMNPELFQNEENTLLFSEQKAMEHYLKSKTTSLKPYPRWKPRVETYRMTIDKCLQFLTQTSSRTLRSSSRDSAATAATGGISGGVVEERQQQQKQQQYRTLVIYHLGDADSALSPSIAYNNVFVFTQAIRQDASLDSTRFYWINVMLEQDGRNLYYDTFFRHSSLLTQWNVGIWLWDSMPSDVYTHIRTLTLLFQGGDEQSIGFDGVFCMNHGVRGPMYRDQAGQWLDDYYALMYPPSASVNTSSQEAQKEEDGSSLGSEGGRREVGLVGSVINCEYAPHVQTHAFLIRASVIPFLIEEYNQYKIDRVDNWNSVIYKYEIALSLFIQSKGFDIAALFHQRHYLTQIKFLNNSYHNLSLQGIVRSENCLERPMSTIHEVFHNPFTWCEYMDYEIPMLKWGGSMFRLNGYVCPTVMQKMHDWLLQYQSHDPDQMLMLPEVMYPVAYEQLYKEYLSETNPNHYYIEFVSLLASPSKSPQTSPQSSAKDDLNRNSNGDHVCFITYVLDEEIEDLLVTDYNEASNYFNREIYVGLKEQIKCKKQLIFS